MDKLIRQLAERVMGWERKNIFDNTNEISYRFGWRWFEKGKAIHYIEDWNPLKDWNDCMGMVRQMIEDGFQFQYWSDSNPDQAQASFYKTGPRHGKHKDESGRTAICMAAAEARGIDKSTK